MIIKDEEKVLARCLSQVKKFADEIVIVDTGSNDNSVNIAKQFGARVYFFKWVDDFSLARNFSFAKSKCDYVMWLDADDVINDINAKKIIALKNSNTDADLFFCKYQTNFAPDDKPMFEFYRERILRRSKNYIWQGFIHECIVPSGKTIFTNIAIEHRSLTHKNPMRNLQIYKKHILASQKLDARAQYYYAKELFYNGKMSCALKELKKYLLMQEKFQPNVEDSYLTIARIFIIKKQYQKALKYLFAMLQNCQINSEVCCLLAESFLGVNNIKNAIHFYESALICKDDVKSGGFIKIEYQKYVPYLMLTSLYYKIGQISKSKHYHSLSKKFFPKDKLVEYNEQFF